MASQLGYSEWDKGESNINTKNKRRNKTLKRKSSLDSGKVETFLNSMNNQDTEPLDGDFDENNLADFEPTKKNFSPPPNPELTKVPDSQKKRNTQRFRYAIHGRN